MLKLCLLNTSSIALFSVTAAVLLTCVIPKKRPFTCPNLSTLRKAIANYSLVDISHDSSTIIVNNESPISLIIAFIVSTVAAFAISFGYQERSFVNFQEHFQGLPYQFLHYALQETVIIQENLLDYWSL